MSEVLSPLASCAPPPLYTIHGSDASLPLLVYVAGMDGTGELFYKQIPSLTDAFRVVTFRLRQTSDATYEDLTDDIAAILQDLRSKTGDECRALVVGESFGGTIALTFALRYPQKLARLVIVNSFPRYRRRLRINLAASLTTLMPTKLIVPFRLASAFLGLTLDSVTRADRRRVIKLLSAIEMKSYARRLQLIRDVDIEDRLAEISAPTLFIATTRDLLVPSVREARRMAARMPKATVKIIKGAGHACLLGNSVLLRDLLADWMSDKD